jgi:HPt (histidine-containing phosphotransfer) domain-containing protein
MKIAEQSSRPDQFGATVAPSNLIDPADGIARVMGDRALYLRMLRRFRDDYQDGAARIGVAVDSGDTRLAHRIAHTLKGASGMISAPALHRLAGGLELALRSGAAGRPASLDALGAALADLLAAIALMLGTEAAPPMPAPPALPPGQALVDRLAALLFNGDGAAVDLVEASAASLTAVLGEPCFRAVALAVNDFDFEGALETLRQAAQAGQATAEQ